MGQSLMERHHFLLRRLHSLTGVAPIGVFMMVHLVTNASVIWGLMSGKYPDMHAGVAMYQHEVTFLHSLPLLLLIEVFGLWLPIAFHSILGVYYATKGKGNLGDYPYQANWRYTLQRVSGYVGVLFIFYHVATLRWGWSFLIPGGTAWSAEYAASTMAAALQGGTQGMTAAGLAVSAGYMLGVSLLVFHLANGLWTAAITWGITVSEGAQKRWGYVCAAIGVGLMGAAWAAVIGFATLDYNEARETEMHLLSGHGMDAESVVESPTPEAESMSKGRGEPERPGDGDG